jgi:hypothetical protein
VQHLLAVRRDLDATYACMRCAWLCGWGVVCSPVVCSSTGRWCALVRRSACRGGVVRTRHHMTHSAHTTRAHTHAHSQGGEAAAGADAPAAVSSDAAGAAGRMQRLSEPAEWRAWCRLLDPPTGSMHPPLSTHRHCLLYPPPLGRTCTLHAKCSCCNTHSVGGCARARIKSRTPVAAARAAAAQLLLLLPPGPRHCRPLAAAAAAAAAARLHHAGPAGSS